MLAQALELKRLEQTVSAGLATTQTVIRELERMRPRIQTAARVAQALKTIRDHRLWQIETGSFREYLERKPWKLSERHAYQLIGYAEVLEQLDCSIEQTIPTESQARELRSVQSEDRKEVWEKTVAESQKEDTPITANRVREMIDRLEAEGKISTAEKKRQQARQAEQQVRNREADAAQTTEYRESLAAAHRDLDRFVRRLRSLESLGLNVKPLHRDAEKLRGRLDLLAQV